jgi:hypothetical protein
MRFTAAFSFPSAENALLSAWSDASSPVLPLSSISEKAWAT